MTDATALPPTAQRYLEQLELRATVLPTAHRVQLLGQVTEHLTEALDEGDDVDAMLARLGSPSELVTAAIDEGFIDEVVARRPKVLLWVGIAALTLGVLLLAMGGGMILLTGRWRASLIALPGIVLAIAGAVALALGTARPRSAATPPR